MTYIDHHEFGRRPESHAPALLHSWDRYTHSRLAWLYGPGWFIERRAETEADLARWNALGNRSAA